MSVLQPSVVECTWSELRSLANGRLCRPTHDGEEEAKEKRDSKVKESGQAVGEIEGKGEGVGGVLELNGRRLLPVHRGMRTY